MIVKLLEKQIGAVFFGLQLPTVLTLSAGGANPFLDVPLQMARSDTARGELHLLCLLAPDLPPAYPGADRGQLLAGTANWSIHRAQEGLDDLRSRWKPADTGVL